MEENNSGAKKDPSEIKIGMDVYFYAMFEQPSIQRSNKKNPTDKPAAGYGIIFKEHTYYDEKLKTKIKDDCLHKISVDAGDGNRMIIRTAHGPVDHFNWIANPYDVGLNALTDIATILREFYDSPDNDKGNGKKKIDYFRIFIKNNELIANNAAFSIDTWRGLGWVKYNRSEKTFVDMVPWKKEKFKELYLAKYKNAQVDETLDNVKMNKSNIDNETYRMPKFDLENQVISFYQHTIKSSKYRENTKLLDDENMEFFTPLRRALDLAIYNKINETYSSNYNSGELI